MVVDPEAKLRADALINRDHILDVARQALAANPQVSLNAIAKAALVGAGTLHRHFPSREALVLSVYRKDLEALVDLAPALLAKHPPLRAFRLWCDRLADFGRMRYGIADLLHSASSGKVHRETHVAMLAAVRILIRACEGAGEIQRGADPEDFLNMVGILWKIPPTTAGNARVKRLLGLAFRGLGPTDS